MDLLEQSILYPTQLCWTIFPKAMSPSKTVPDDFSRVFRHRHRFIQASVLIKIPMSIVR